MAADDFPSHQLFDLEGLYGRLDFLVVCSPTGTDSHSRMRESISVLFDECQQEGLCIPVRTKLYFGY